MPYLERGQKGFGRALAALFAGGFVTFAILYSTQPLLPVLSADFHVSPAVASLSVSLTTAILAIFMLLTSAWSEDRGRKSIMVASVLASSVLAILTALAPSFLSLLVLRAVVGATLAGLPAIAMAYVNEEFHPATLGIVMGMYVSGTSVGGMSGRILVGAMSDLWSWRGALAGLGIISLAASILFWRGLPASRHFTPKPGALRRLAPSLAAKLRDPGLLTLYGLGFVLMGSFVTLYNYLGYELMGPPYHLSQTWVGLIFLVYLSGTFSSTWMGRLADKHGRVKILWVGLGLSIAGALLTLAQPLGVKIAATALFTSGFFGSHAIASAWVGKRAKTEKAEASSLYLLFYYAGSSLAGVTGGFLWTRFGWPGVIGLIVGLLGVGLLLAGGLQHLERLTIAAAQGPQGSAGGQPMGAHHGR
ncbi:MFS transporter [Kyrpidia sp.]|uniref:MFS transporter n=1 Tax=Kyrpidia sp. TaxID=2073077 RepID=UPI002586B330|nr:MFS transporter [Kyrpidia sp.]MCL6576180.1 MFS transporter [Kyrpidia sp.]